MFQSVPGQLPHPATLHQPELVDWITYPGATLVAAAHGDPHKTPGPGPSVYPAYLLWLELHCPRLSGLALHPKLLLVVASVAVGDARASQGALDCLPVDHRQVSVDDGA